MKSVNSSKLEKLSDVLFYISLVCWLTALPWVMMSTNNLALNILIMIVSTFWLWTYTGYWASRDVARESEGYGGRIKFKEVEKVCNNWIDVIDKSQWIKYFSSFGGHYFVSEDRQYMFADRIGLIDAKTNSLQDSTVFNISPMAIINMRGMQYSVSYLDSIRLQWLYLTRWRKIKINSIAEVSPK